jgi:hypothetical protein
MPHEITEHDESGALTATYISSATRGHTGTDMLSSRIDIVVRAAFPPFRPPFPPPGWLARMPPIRPG